jgi:heme exporter protein D
MDAANHMGFIVASYAAAVVVVGGLILWVVLDYYAQRRKLIALDKKGVTRRSAQARAEPTLEQAKEKA